jgi:glycosyltransferase involved in cell wall biosynthesis
MKKIKILHIQLLPLLSGVQKMMLLLLDSLDPEQYEIHVVAKPGGPLIKRLEDSGYNFIPVGSLHRNLSPFDIIALIKLYKICKLHNFDIVHTHSSKTGFLGRIAARLAKVPKIIHTAHGFPYHSCQPFYARYLYMLLESFAGHFCNKVVVVNQYERYEAKRKRIIPNNKLQTIYNGIDTDPHAKPRIYDSDGLLKSPAKTMPDLKDSFVIGTVARFTAAKNIVNMTRLAIKVCRRNPKIKFVFVGDGEIWQECNRIVFEEGLDDRIILPGWQENVGEWLNNFEVYFLFSYWEGLSISILEAMNQGLPIIASNIKGNNELVSLENGLLIDVNDHDKIVDSLVSLPFRHAELQNWSKNSLSRIKEKFSLRSFVTQYRELYEKDFKAMKRK